MVHPILIPVELTSEPRNTKACPEMIYPSGESCLFGIHFAPSEAGLTPFAWPAPRWGGTASSQTRLSHLLADNSADL